MKKYKLKIPEMIKSSHAWLADALQLTNMTIDENFTFETRQGALRVKNIPIEWLEEIKEESAFQKWEGEDKNKVYGIAVENVIVLRKQGWNAALDEVKEFSTGWSAETICLFLHKKLKEIKEP